MNNCWLQTRQPNYLPPMLDNHGKTITVKNHIHAPLCRLACVCVWLALLQTTVGDYAVVISAATYADKDWRAVADALVANHHATLVKYNDDVRTATLELAALLPDAIGFVVRPAEANREFVATVHRLTRQLDNDPYTDAMWGIVTGYDASDALRMARQHAPLLVRRAVSSMGPGILDRMDGGFASSETSATNFWKKTHGRLVATRETPDAVCALVDGFNQLAPEFFITSGHATERDWQVGYNIPAGEFICDHGQLFGHNTRGEKFPINSPNPKVYVAAGNCLMGHIPHPDCMATAWLHSGGVQQLVGYTVATWFGYGGWGTLDLFTSGRHTLAEAFYFNNQALLHRLQQPTDDRKGLLYDRDTVAFYGDPGWAVRFPPADPGWTQSLTWNAGRGTFTLTTTRDGEWPNRPVMAFLPVRLTDTTVLAGTNFNPVVTDNFILVPLAGKFRKGEQIQVDFTGHPLDRPARREAWQFLLANLPAADRAHLPAGVMQENVEYALRARAGAPWGRTVPREMFLNGVLPYANLDEPRDPWRKEFFERFAARAWKCATPGAAARLLNREIFKELGVEYHATKRPKPNQSPKESIAAHYASCTGLSILLVDACRACGIPARVVGIPLWKNKGGNHTWVEVWTEGRWHCLGANEDTEFDQTWFAETARTAAVDPSQPQHRIYAASFQQTGLTFPLVWDEGTPWVPAVDVTADYRR